jgi:hypothetical protein
MPRGASATLERSTVATYGQIETGAQTSGLPDDALLVARLQKEADPWGKIIDDLHAILRLRDDWDGLGAEAPSPALAISALHIAEGFRRTGVKAPSRVVASLGGTVVFEWQNAEAYAELELTRPYHGEAMMAVPGHPTEHRVLSMAELLR